MRFCTLPDLKSAFKIIGTKANAYKKSERKNNMTRKTRLTRSVLSILLAALMIFSVMTTGIGFEAKAATEYVTDGGFESDLWSSGNWSLSAASGNYYDNATIEWFSYDDDSYITSVEGDYCFKYYLSSAVTSSKAIKATQTVSLPAGTYTFTILSMGGDGAKVAPIINGSIGTFTEVDGWNQWQELTYTITLSSAKSSYTVGFAIIGDSGAWGYIDGVSIQAASSTGSVTYGGVTITPVDDLDDDFILGVDVSSVISLENAGVKFYDFTGSYEQDIFKTLAQAGVNTVRVRVWVDPYNSSTGVGYGGGNNDLDTAIEIGKRATAYGMGVLVDFHFSDFWCDPGSQTAPKAWSSYSVSNKSTALYNYCYSSLQSLINAGVDVTMVQIGNETTNGFCGETSWSNMCTLMKSGASAVRAIDSSILIAVHFTNPEYGLYPTYAGYLNTYGVDYDVFASSYYPYWHGTLTNLTSVLGNVAETYNKKVMVAETAWAYTYTDGDGHSNTISSSSGITETYAISAQGQADEYRAVVNAVNNATNGCGVLWWEPAWIPVNDVSSLSGSAYTTAYNANKTAWETYGCGWASSSAAEYSDDAGSYYGGSAWDNQAMFDFGGTPLDSLMVFNLVQGKNTLNSVNGSSTTTTTTTTTQTTTTTTTASAATGLDGYYYIKSKYSNLYLNTANDCSSNSAAIVQEDGDGAMAQRFRLVSTGTEGVYYIYTGASNYTKAVDISGRSTSDGASVIQYTYNGNSNQQFKLVKVGDYYAILTGVSGYASCLDVYDWSTTAGDPIKQYSYWGGDCQLYKLESCSSGTSSTTTTTKATTTTTKAATTTTKATTTTTKPTTTTTKATTTTTKATTKATTTTTKASSSSSSSNYAITIKTSGNGSSLAYLMINGYHLAVKDGTTATYWENVAAGDSTIIYIPKTQSWGITIDFKTGEWGSSSATWTGTVTSDMTLTFNGSSVTVS